MPRRPLAIARLLAPLAVLSLTGCALSGGTTPPPGAPTSAAVAPVPTTTPSWTPTVAEPTLTPTPSGTSPLSTPSAGASTANAVITVPAGTQKQLTEADAASIGTWIRGSFQPAGGAATVESLAQPVLCGDTSAPLRLKFANTAGTLTIGAAQSATSVSSTETLTWTVVTDGRLQQTQRLSFGQSQDLTVPLAGVADVEISVTNQDTCTGSAIALITKAAVAG